MKKRSIYSWKLLSVLVMELALGASSVLCASSIEDRLLSIFEQKCSECHNGDETPDLHKGINLSELAASKHVVMHDPEKSDLMARLLLPDTDKKRMPKSRGQPGAETYRDPLTDEELTVVRQWISGSVSGGTKPSAFTTELPHSVSDRVPHMKDAPRRFITHEELNEYVMADLALGIPEEQRNWRYLTLQPQWNQPAVRVRDLEVFEQGVSKLVNSLSWLPEIKRPRRVIGDELWLLRIDLRDYGLGQELWTKLLAHYPMGIAADPRLESEIVKMAGTWPVLRADWFVYICSQAPLYNEILKLPASSLSGLASKTERAESRLELMLGINAGENARSGKVFRMGFEHSDVSRGNRVVERHELGSHRGYYWKSFDFQAERTQVDARRRPADVFSAPLGPPSYGLSSSPLLQFGQDGGEIIFSLPNGMQAYMLVDGDGKSIETGPNDVVADLRHPRNTIHNGISCIACHSEGLNSPIRGKRDEVYTTALNMKTIVGSENELIRLLYGRQKELDDLMQSDMRSFREALAKCGVTQGEPIWSIYNQYFLEPVRVEQVSAELGSQDTRLVEKLRQSSNEEIRKFLSRPSIPRAIFERLYGLIAAEIGLQVRSYTELPVAETRAEFAKGGTGGGGVTSVKFSSTSRSHATTNIDSVINKGVRARLIKEDEDGDAAAPVGKIDVSTKIEIIKRRQRQVAPIQPNKDQYYYGPSQESISPVQPSYQN